MKNKIIKTVACIMGIILCAYPFVSSMVQRQFQNEAVATHQEAVTQAGNLDQVLQEAREYNDMLCQVGDAIVGDVQDNILSSENYNKQLNVSGNRIMGAIKIPKINVNLPIYHGTEEEDLTNGIGHLEGSSLPVGGKIQDVFSPGIEDCPMPNFFTRLDELEAGDYFFLDVCGETLAYQVCAIEVIEPDDLEKLVIQPEKDLVTLVTCTPYGLNTQRLIVTGERVSYEKRLYDSITPKMYSVREVIFTAIPFAAITAVVIKLLKNRKRCKDGKN